MIRDQDLPVALCQDPHAPPVVNQEVTKTNVGSVVHGELLEDPQKGKSRWLVSRLLHVAAKMGFIPGVRLLANGADIGDTRNKYGPRSLHGAAYFVNIDVVRLLLEKGANIDPTRSSDDGSTLLYFASWRRHAGVVRLLLEKVANVEATRSDIRATPLDAAAYFGHADVVKLLLDKQTW